MILVRDLLEARDSWSRDRNNRASIEDHISNLNQYLPCKYSFQSSAVSFTIKLTQSLGLTASIIQGYQSNV